MNWSNVGDWIKNNAGSGTALVGSLLTGNVPGAIAAGAALVSSATGTDDPANALNALKSDPASVVRLRELYYQNEADIMRHMETIHAETQKTIRAGDVSTDEYVRRTRPQMARQSWFATVIYCLGCWAVQSYNGGDMFNMYLAGTLSAPAWAYLGLRTGDKFASAIGSKK